mgnify:FL=1
MYRLHHICNTYLSFPPEDQLQSALEHHISLSDPWLQKNKISGLFAKALANRERSPNGVELNVHLVICAHKTEIPRKYRKKILTLFTQVLIEIATKYTNELPASS